ncbi:hypothetical protein ACHAXR_006909 [Thalassiosira sp. AJA248-18]
MSQKTKHSTTVATTTSSPHPPTLLDRIRALDKSSELSQRYTPLILFHPWPSKLGDESSFSPANTSYVAVGHAETSFINSVLIHCKSAESDPIFVKDRLPNKNGVVTDVLRLHMDVQIQEDAGCNFLEYNHSKLFQKRSDAFEQVTNHLLAAGVISGKHSDVYPISPFVKPSTNFTHDGHGEKVVLAHVNRNTAPYLGIDSVGVHLHCYVCQKNEETSTTVKGVWLAKRAPTKSHHPNYWDPTVAGGQPANLSLIDNIVKEAHEEAGVPGGWIRDGCSKTFSDHTHDPLTITTAKTAGTCMKRSLYYSCDLEVPNDWTPTPVDGEVSEFKLYSMHELEEELRSGNNVRPAMRAVLLDFMMRHDALEGEQNLEELSDAMRKERLMLW